MYDPNLGQLPSTTSAASRHSQHHLKERPTPPRRHAIWTHNPTFTRHSVLHDPCPPPPPQSFPAPTSVPSSTRSLAIRLLTRTRRAPRRRQRKPPILTLRTAAPSTADPFHGTLVAQHPLCTCTHAPHRCRRRRRRVNPSPQLLDPTRVCMLLARGSGQAVLGRLLQGAWCADWVFVVLEGAAAEAGEKRLSFVVVSSVWYVD